MRIFSVCFSYLSDHLTILILNNKKSCQTKLQYRNRTFDNNNGSRLPDYKNVFLLSIVSWTILYFPPAWYLWRKKDLEALNNY